MEKAQQQKLIIVVLLGVFLIAAVRSRLVAMNSTPAASLKAKNAQAGAGGEVVIYQPNNVSVEYKPGNARDPFKSPAMRNLANIKASAKKIKKVELPQMTLQGVIWNVQEPMAVINGQVVKVGDNIAGAEIAAIEKGTVYLLYNDKEVTLVLTDAAEGGE